MSITPNNLSEVSADTVAAIYAQQSQYMSDTNPGIEQGRGPFADLVLLPDSQLNAVMQLTVDRLQRSMSLAAIEADPALADDAIVDAALSNHNVTRYQGTQSTGSVTMVVSQPSSVVFPQGARFQANNQVFVTTAAFTASPTAAALAGPADRLMTPLPGGNYSFTFNVVAEAIGSAGNLVQNTKLAPDAAPTYFVTAYAAGDFSGGHDTETNEALITRLQLGDSAKSGGSRTNYVAFIKDQEQFSRTLFYSVVGLGDVEMRRDRYGLMPVSRGGCVDVYARPAEVPITTSVEMEAVFVEGTTWQLSIDNDVFPGFYEVSKIVDVGEESTATGFAVTSDVRGLDFTGKESPPTIPNTEDGRYSSYQTAVIQFDDPATVSTTDVGCKKNVVVFLTGMPQISDLQNLFSSDGNRPMGASVLVKAATPCKVSIGVDVVVKATAGSVNSEAIISAIAAVVNNLDFGEPIYTSLIDKAVLPLLSPGQVVGRIDIVGTILDASGDTQAIVADRVLTIPSRGDVLISPRTTAFILDPARITVTTTRES